MSEVIEELERGQPPNRLRSTRGGPGRHHRVPRRREGQTIFSAQPELERLLEDLLACELPYCPVPTDVRL